MTWWQEELLDIVVSVSGEVERLFEGIDEIVDAIFDLTEEIGEQVGKDLVSDTGVCLGELLEELVDLYSDLGDTGFEESNFTYQVEAGPLENPACVGCSNYHGEVYGGNLLVCAMHPYGWDGEKCPDWGG
ncbi:hypothetical protein CEP10_05865 [Cylindrospermopsis raciborskii S07]|uniref:Uncharacterized protein n=2 Tax=Cylindrospermopsis raciborskii TaxID=77022 RepID=A0A853MDY8_9CYAN|nr:hypothetical protein [Cylindrospermopsis raciborskii]EFA70649.1 conserved hypothetical protein [Cylindrospermopsis raciborskii CS-505]OBU77561.1 hypothetical protein A9P98_15695 [Cylindrospermopsis raciborskii CS-505]OHY35750.1 hypothetical protein BCV63_15725 [Cylindrospermopsis raciborskii CS-508]PNJ94422.1 hypothetical protein CEP14_10835 [Cylindrospermopsis raciborskii C04]PNJ94541.1 hypothetical protein CEP13_10605 [Cylindrospermopsis raciborskii C03]